MLDYRLLYEITKLLAAETDIKKLLPLAMDKVIGSANAQRGMILICGEDGGLLFETARNLDKKDIELPEFEVSKTIIASVLKSGEPVVLKNAMADRKFVRSKSIAELNLLSVACVALKHDDKVIGAVYIDNRDVSALFDHETEELLREFTDMISVIVKNAIDHRFLVQRQHQLERELTEKKPRAQLIGSSPKIKGVLQLVDDVAVAETPVLITGETGTGKEYIARLLHEKSPRAKKEFVALNCTALQASLLESELFGHEKGAFTGAHQRKAGWFEVANKGTLFLDEIGELEQHIQAKLLRFLQFGEYAPVGSTQLKRAEVRVIAATNRDLQQLIKDGKFREDFYYRLNVIELQIPPLRARGDDVIEIADFFLLRYTSEFKKPGLRLSEAARSFLRQYDFPGNVRELENMIQRAVLLTHGDTIEVHHLKLGQPEAAAPAATTGSNDFNEAKRLIVESFERDFLNARLHETKGNISKAAKLAGMYKANFIQKMQKYGIDRKEFTGTKI